MGMDIFSEKGFVLTLKQFLDLIEPAHLAGIKSAAMTLFRQRISDEELDGPLAAAAAAIESAAGVDDISAALQGMFATSDCDDEEACFEDDQRLALIASISRILLPLEPTSIRVFTSSRLSGFSVPIGEPVLLFNFADCFEVEVRMTGCGQAMARTLAQEDIKPDEWTELSV
jgi:hypothetical protein